MSHSPLAIDFDWIASQERWDTVQLQRGPQRIAREIESLRVRLTTKVSRHLVVAEEPKRELYERRIWHCIEYHWRRFAEKGHQRFSTIVERIERGELPYGRVPANVLQEVVLAQALELGEDKAAEVFESEYMPQVRAIAGRCAGPRAVDAVENFAAELVVPRGERPPRIATYMGRTPLVQWLRAVVVNFCISGSRHPQLRVVGEIPDTGQLNDPAQAMDRRECQGLLGPVFAGAVEKLGAEDRLLLQMLILDSVPQNEIARSLGLNSGTITRRRQRAAGLVFENVRQLAAQSANPGQASDCLQLLLAGDDTELRGRLAEVLAQAVRHERQA